MASLTLKAPLLRQVAARGYAQAAPASQNLAKVTSSVTANGTVLAALENGSCLTRVTVAFKAGARYEPATELGISHMLRSAAGLTTAQASAFMIHRKLSQLGASVTASGDREFIYYTLEATQENLMDAVSMFTNVISNQEFRPWELSDNVPRLKYDLAAVPPQVRAINLLHKGAFRRGLGNSLFISKKRIEKISSESLQHYSSEVLAPGRCAIAIVGDTIDKANLIAQQLQLGSGSKSAAEPSVYHGGEIRKEIGGDLAHVALAVQGAPAGSPQSLALAIAAKALGNGPAVKWGTDHSPLAKAIGNIGPFAAAGFNVSYSDNGLFGVTLTVPKDEANAAVKSVAKFLKSPTLSADAIKAGKNQLKVQVLSEAEDGLSLAEGLAAQGLYTGSAKSPAEIAASIDQLQADDINQAVANAAKTKPSMGAAGSIAFVPYVDEL